MEIPELVMDKERKNLYHIYLFYMNDTFWAFGYSAYYLSIIYPVLEATKEALEDHGEYIPCVHVPESYLLKLSDFYNTLVSDTYIQISAPPTAYCYRKAYDEWCGKLTNCQLI